MKCLPYFFVVVVLSFILVDCKGSKDKEQSIFVGTWQSVRDTEKQISIIENNDRSFELVLDNFNFLENGDLITSEQTKKELILKSLDKGSIYSFHMIDKNQLEFYFSANPNENIVGESPPLILRFLGRKSQEP